MSKKITTYRDNIPKNKYLFCSAKKIFLKRTDSTILLLEKIEKRNNKSISLTKRNTIVINKNTKFLLFSSSKK